MLVMGIDAGLSTGLAVVDIPEDGDAPATLRRAVQFKETNLRARISKIRGFKRNYRPDVTVAEQFDLRPNNEFVADLTTVETNAVLEYVYGGNINWVTPAQHKRLVGNTVLKNLDLWQTGKMVGEPDANDANDALRMCVYWVVSRLKHRPTTEKGYPDDDDES